MATTAQIVARALSMARQGKPESELRIWDDAIWRLVPDAYRKLATIIADDPKRRGILTVSYPVTLVDGVADLSGAAFDNLLREKLCYASFFDSDDADKLNSYIHKTHWQELHRWLNPAFGYFSLKNNSLITRARGIEDLQSALTTTPGNNATLIAPSVPTTTVPPELEDEAVAILAAMAIASADQIAAHTV